jgi:tetratricopeptide (TPR) repeat protein
LKPDLADAYFFRGKILINNGDFDHAVADFSKVIELQPGSADAYGYRAGAEISLGNQDGALADYGKAIELKPNVAEIYSTRGDIRFLKGDFAGALADFDQCLKLDPNGSPMLQIYRHLLLPRVGQAPDDIAATIAGWKDGWPKTIGLFLAGRMNENDFLAAAKSGAPDAADDRTCQAYYFAGMMHLLGNDPTGARQLFKQCAIVDGATVLELDLAKAEAARLDHPPAPAQ